MKKLSVAFLTLVLVSACGGGNNNKSSSGSGANANSAPLITSNNVYSVAEGSTSIGVVTATDADGDNLTFSLAGVDAGVISIGSSSGALSFNTAPDYEKPTDASTRGDNVYNVTAKVGDGTAFDARDLVITVTNNNDAPVITSGGSYEITENVTVIGNVDVTDSDAGDTLEYSLSGDDADLMTISSAGALAFISPPDFENPTDASTPPDNIYEAEVTVTDGTAQASQAINVTVTDLDEGTPATGIFISEYAEGSSNNKYLEIANNTGASVSLDDYALANTSNAPNTAGEYEFWNEVFGTGSSIANNDVFVVCHGSASAEIAAKCDANLNFLSNGDDGFKLVKGGTFVDADEDGKKDAGEVTGFTVIDVLGDFQGDPGSGWDVCGVTNGTVDHTLIKKEGVEGNTDWTASRGTSAEDCDWIVKEKDDNSDLGQHCWESEFAAESIAINNESGAVSVAENGTSVATVSTTVSACGSAVYTLTGVDKELFTISSAGVVVFATAPDYENPTDTGADNVYNFTVEATNGEASASLDMVVTVTDVEEDIPTYSGQVYFSEYTEGAGDHKYLEIFNGTTATINLDEYAYPNVSNSPDVAGEYEYWNAFDSGKTLGKGQVYVVCHPGADAAIKAECDEEHIYLSNGDDGYALVKGTEASYTVLDRIGTWTEQGPWDVCGSVGATKDATLVKKSDKYGTDDWAVSAGTSAEDCYWEVKAKDAWDGLGSHTETEVVTVTPLVITVTTDGSAVRLTGPWWNWDPNGGPVATDNGDGTWKVTFETPPTDNMEYLWVVDGVQENLVDNAAAGECTAEVEAGEFNTDYNSYANRIHKVGSGDKADVYDACSGTSTVTPLVISVTTDGSAVRLTGPWWNWDPNGGPVATDNGDGTWKVTFETPPTDNMEYLWVVDGVQENLVDNAAAGECTAEVEAGEFNTDYSGYANRIHKVGSGDKADVYDACSGTSTVTPLVISVTTDGSAVRLTGPWWNWDPNGGPVATDNGDGTWKVTFETPPTDNMEYLWVVDGVQENLVDNAAAGECTAEVEAGEFNTDYSGYANRIHKVGSGDKADVYDACSGTSTGGGTTDATQYCATKVTHFGIEAETASEVELTISRVDANNVDVSVKSTNNDPVDLVLIGAQSGEAAGVSAMTLANGVATVRMTWNNGAPDSTSFEVLWSKESSGGNWMLRKEDLPSIDTKSTCATSEPTGLNISVTTSGSAVRLTGPWWNWDPNGGPVATDNGDGTWKVTFETPPTDNMEYLWVVDGVQENLVDNAAAGECTAEVEAGEFNTDYSGYANRIHKVGSGDKADVYDACSGTSTGGGTTDATQYCATKVTHFGIEAETTSEVFLWVSRVDANNVDVVMVSNDKAVDELIIGAMNDQATIGTKEIQGGIASIRLTWNNGAPDSTSFEILWSKVDMGGNWMLRREDVPNIDTKSSCSDLPSINN